MDRRPAASPSTAPAALDASRCPLCGQANTCAVTAGLPPADCWCMDTPIAPQALAAIPAAQRRLACVCPRCAAGLPPAA